MLSKEQDVSQKWLKIKEDDKFFSRLLSKESSMANPSLRVYYGGVSGAVPFTWESQPGTPKHPFSESVLPPLTPPPSYYSNAREKKSGNKQARSNLLHSIFSRMNRISPNKAPQVLSSPSLSSSCSSWSSASPRRSSLSMSGSLTPNFLRRRRQCCSSSSRSSFDSKGCCFEEEEAAVSPTSTLCFRMGGGGGLRGRCSVVVMKKAFLSMVGHGSGQGTA